ncbi:MAG: glycosyltransferase, partial [Acidobacteriota bacterium]|nr:glycosyltransferase [Acidobacteriota bacterium]
IMGKRLKESGFADEDFLVTKIPHSEIPKYLSASDIALSFIKPCFSKLSSSPTKIAEYLASGIPIITNRGVGDVSEIIEKHQTGAVVQDFSRESYIESLKKIGELRQTNDLYEKCIKSAKEEFDLEEVGGVKYRSIYKRLSSKSSVAAHTLYLCYFSLHEPLVQTQVLPYLREIKKIDDMKVSLLTFEPDFKEKWATEQIVAEKKKFAEENITWHCLPYHKRPSVPATVYDIFCGAWFIWRLMRREKIDVLHARAHIAAIFGLIARNFSRYKPKLLFDIRGFVPEEYTDAGIWKENGWIYKVFKRFEKWILRESDGFVVLTENAREILFPESAETGFDKLGRPVEVIPCCVDFERRFQGNKDKLRKKTRDELNLNDRLVITHLGALGGLYLTEDIANFLQAAKSKYPNTFASFLTQTSPDSIITLLKERGFTEEDFFVGKISPTEVQRYLSASDIALSFVKATYATASRSPTKIPEYLACGLPIVSNRGVGDVDELIIEENVGILLNDFSSESYADALKQVITLGNDANFINKSQICAKNRFDLERVGGERYRRIYKDLLNGTLDAISTRDSLKIAGKIIHRRRLN